MGSHLRVAVCWNNIVNSYNTENISSHLRVAVCWNWTPEIGLEDRSAATFGWLCVETVPSEHIVVTSVAATFGWLCVETRLIPLHLIADGAATFGWLCVETWKALRVGTHKAKQPPSGGCVLKQKVTIRINGGTKQPPSGGCVLKHSWGDINYGCILQPPSGGCVLKLSFDFILNVFDFAATFGWLCVETSHLRQFSCHLAAATFGWLCVETRRYALCKQRHSTQPPSGGCVLKLMWLCVWTLNALAATFGWLCVETVFCW